MALLRWLLLRVPRLRWPLIIVLLLVAAASPWLPAPVTRFFGALALAHVMSVVIAGMMPWVVVGALLLPILAYVVTYLGLLHRHVRPSQRQFAESLIISGIFWISQAVFLPVQAYLLLRVIQLDQTFELLIAGFSVLEYLFFLALARDAAKQAALVRGLWSLAFLGIAFVPAALVWVPWVIVFHPGAGEPVSWATLSHVDGAQPFGCLMMLWTAVHLFLAPFVWWRVEDSWEMRQAALGDDEDREVGGG